jgi:hypothetical protein
MARSLGSMTRKLVLVGAVLALVGPAVPAGEGFEERFSLSSEQLLVRNLVGQIRVEGHAGPAFEVVLQADGRDVSRERVRFEVDEGAYGELIVEFPIAESRRYVYPRLGRSTTSIDTGDSGSWLDSLFGSGSVKVSGSGSGLELWVDATIRVPRGASLKVEHGVGEITVSDVGGNVDLAVHSGPVEVRQVEGRVVVDTGSGSVRIADVRGDVTADTGSGQVAVARSNGERLVVDTGSGRVEIEDVEARRVSIDTGSGRVEAAGLGTDELEVDTGSGGVSVELERMGTGRFQIDTGSGGIDLQLPAGASADLVCDTGSGGIELDLAAGHEVLQRERDTAHVRIGEGTASVKLDTGSGGIRVSQTR